MALRSYAQKNPLVEYKLEGYDIFDKMIDQIKTSVAKTIIRVQIRVEGPARPVNVPRKVVETHRESSSFGVSSEGSNFANMAAKQQQTARQASNAGATSSIQVVRSTPKVGRNDPCPCGSGKKYKNCCGRNQGV